jgi:putative ABC transport system permease protein
MKMKHTPQLPLRFFRWFCHPKLRDSIEGDLMELYEERKAKSGKLKADLKFIFDVLLLFRPGIIKPTEGYQTLNTYGMYKNYFKISLRNLIKNKTFAFINVSSLAVGLAACVVIYLFVSDERSFDTFHSKSKNIYRLDEVQKFTGTNEQKVALSMPGMAPAMKRDFPEVKSYVRFWLRGKQLITKDDTKQLIENVMVADSTFLMCLIFH